MIKIAIDAGHGLYTSGKRCMKKLDSKETREWWLNDRIADRLEALLDDYNCEVLRTDDTTGLTDVSLANRCKKANNWGADIFVSIHHNAGANGKTAGGTVNFYYSSNSARKTQAQSMYNSVVGRTKLVGNRSSKVIKKGFYVLRHTKMKAFLLENGFMDSSVDVPIILTAEHAEKTAQGLLEFLVRELKLEKISNNASSTVATPVSTSFKVKVKVKELNIRSGAGTDYARTGCIKDYGIYTIVSTARAKDGGTWGKLKSGIGWINISSKFVSRV